MSKTEIFLIVFAVGFFLINVFGILYYESNINIRKQLEDIDIEKNQVVSDKKHLKLIEKFTRRNS